MPNAESVVPTDAFNSLPDVLLLLILDLTADAKTLTRCAAVSRRFRSLLGHVHTIVLKPDTTPFSHADIFSRLCRHILKSPNLTVETNLMDHGSSATYVLRNFDGVKFLRMELPSPELGLENGSLLKWSASFGSMLTNCVVLGASSVIGPGYTNISPGIREETSPSSLGESIIPESFYTNGDLKSRVVWTISSLIAASARYKYTQPLIKQHKWMERLVVNDVCGQGVLRMDREQLKDARTVQQSVSPSKERKVVPDLEMRLWYKEQVVLENGSVMTGVTLGAIRPKGKMASVEEFLDGNWVAGAFEEPFATAVKVLVKGRSYRVDMDSF